MASIRVRGFKKTQAVLVAVQKKFGETFDAQRRLVRMMTRTYRPRSHRQPAGLNARLANGYRVRRAEFLRQCRHRQHPLRKGRRTEKGSSRAVRRVVNELPAPHKSLLDERLGPETTCFGRTAPRVGYGFFCAR